jgi:VanZ family protein
MGKKEIRVIHIPRWVTVALLILVTAAMAAAIYALSGHAYRLEPSFAEIILMARKYDRGMATNSALLATIAPAAADILFFLPWGALAFLSFDPADGKRGRAYAATLLVGVAFALTLVAWQLFLPTRVTGWPDVVWNALGCAGGASLGHARKRVRIRFET